MTTLFALENSIDFGANLLAKVSPARDPTAKNAKEGLSRLLASTRQFLKMLSDHSLAAIA